MYSKSERAEVRGHLGFSNLRGRDHDSFENQLARMVKSRIRCDSRATYEDLLREYSHVVMATGDASYTVALQDYDRDLTASLSGATVEGAFDRFTARAWMDNTLAPKGYGYLIPMSRREAHIVISYPDYPELGHTLIESRWDRFYRRVRRDLQQDLRVTDRFQIRNYLIGLCRYPRIGNTYFTGNCFGAIMPFLGFGQFPALLTGIYAARDISGRGSYERLSDHLRESYRYSLTLRRGYEMLGNEGMDALVRFIDTSWGERLFASRYNLLRMGARLLRPLVVGRERRV